MKIKVMAAVLLLGLLVLPLAACTGADTTATGENSGQTAATAPAIGTIAVYVTDAPPDEEVTAIEVTVSGLAVHLAEAEREQDQDAGASANTTPVQAMEQEQDGEGSGEWLTIPVSDNMTTFDLLQVRDIEAFFGSANVTAGHYTQVRLTVDAATVTTADGQVREADVPSGELKIVRAFDVPAGGTITLLLDFDADRSVVFTGSDKVQVKPVVTLAIGTGQSTRTGANGNGNGDGASVNGSASGNGSGTAAGNGNGNGSGAATTGGGGMCLGISCNAFGEQSDITHELTVPLGTPLTLTLCSNASTGYSWNEQAVIADESIISQASHGFVEPEAASGMVGASGHEEWIFGTLAPGTTTLNFSYTRPWETNVDPVWTFELTVTVE